MQFFNELDEYCKKGQIVFVGSTYFSKMKISERIATSGIDIPVYDRSYENLKINDALNYLTYKVFKLQPSKIFINIGDEDLKSPIFSVDSFISKYEWMLLNTHRSCSKVFQFITSIVSSSPMAVKVNERLRCLAKETGCTFINFGNLKKDEDSYVKVFNNLKQYITELPVKFQKK